LYLQPDAGLMLWVAGADVVDGQADPRGTVLIDHGATLGEVSDYFGPWLVGPRPRLALWPAEGLGAGPGIEWLTLGRGALEVYGAMEAVRTAVGGVLAHHRAPLRRDAQRWIGDGVVTRRLNRFLLERDEWEIRELQAYLDLGFSELANILRQLGYETTPGAPERWTRCT
jgi:hypothetical protein